MKRIFIIKLSAWAFKLMSLMKKKFRFLSRSILSTFICMTHKQIYMNEVKYEKTSCAWRGEAGVSKRDPFLFQLSSCHGFWWSNDANVRENARALNRNNVQSPSSNVACPNVTLNCHLMRMHCWATHNEHNAKKWSDFPWFRMKQFKLYFWVNI